MSAFTLIELLVVIAIIGLLISLMSPSLGQARRQAQGVACMNNQRQIGVGFYSYAGDNQGYYPKGRHNPGTPEGIMQHNTWYSEMTPWMDPSAQPGVEVWKIGGTKAAEHNAIWRRMLCPAQDISLATIRHGVPQVYGYHIALSVADYNIGIGIQLWPRPNWMRMTGEIPRPSSTLALLDNLSIDYVYRTAWQAVGYGAKHLPDRHDGYNGLFADGHVRRIASEKVQNPDSDIWGAP